MKTKILFLLILLLSVCGSIIVGRELFSALSEYKAGEEIYEEISRIARNPIYTETAESINPERT